MKKLIVAAITMASVAASASQYVTVTVCDRGYTGSQCETITYKVKAGEGVPAESYNPSQEHNPTATGAVGVPAWLKKLNDAFGGGKGTAPEKCGAGELYPC
jgi:hypothetical protein